MVEIEFTGDRNTLTITPTVTGQVDDMPEMTTITIYGLTDEISTISWKGGSGKLQFYQFNS